MFIVRRTNPWFVCRHCNVRGYIDALDDISQPGCRINLPPADKLSAINTILRRICGTTCRSMLQLARLKDLFGYWRGRVVIPAYDAPDHQCNALTIYKRDGKLFMSLYGTARDGVCHRLNEPYHPCGGFLLSKKLYDQSDRVDTLFIMPIADALYLHIEHAGTCDCTLPVVSAFWPEHLSPNIIPVINLPASNRRIIGLRMPTVGGAMIPQEIAAWAEAIDATIFTYTELPTLPSVHVILNYIKTSSANTHLTWNKGHIIVRPTRDIENSVLVVDCRLAVVKRGNRVYDVRTGELLADFWITWSKLIMPRRIHHFDIYWRDKHMSVRIFTRRDISHCTIGRELLYAVKILSDGAAINKLSSSHLVKLIMLTSNPVTEWTGLLTRSQKIV